MSESLKVTENTKKKIYIYIYKEPQVGLKVKCIDLCIFCL